METGKEISYPKDSKLRQAFQGLIKLVLTEGTVRFQTQTAIEAIMDYMQLIDDKATNPKAQPGANYKKAKNYLKTLSKYARLVPGTFGIVEVFVFTTDGKRIQTLDDLKQICSEDPEMNKAIAAFDEFDYSQKWLGPLKIVENPFQVSSELARIDNAVNAKKALVAAAPPVERHTGPFKGRDDLGAARKAFKAAVHVPKRKSRDRGKEISHEEKSEREQGAGEIRADDINHRNQRSEFT